MKTNPYYPRSQNDQVAWLLNLADKAPGYATVLGLSTGTVTALKADCGWAAYVMGSWQTEARSWASGITDTIIASQTGTASGAMTLPAFTAPVPPTGVTPVAEGALTRIFALVQQIKKSGKCNDNMARDLGIIGSEQSDPHLATIQPVIALSIVSGQVLVKWNWQGNAAYLDSCEIQVDRGDGKGFVLLTVDTTPNYTDTQPFPITPAKWIYRAIYRVGDDRVGNWSASMSITVGA